MDWLMHLAGAVLAAAMAMTSLRSMRLLLLVAGVIGLAWLISVGVGAGWLIWVCLFVIINGVQIAIMIQGGRTGDMRAEERELLSYVLQVEDPTGQRRLLDLMRWRDVPAGETLIREGEADPPLVYLASGSGVVTVGGRAVSACGTGDFLGEMSLVTGQRASATVTAGEPMRIAVFDRDALRQLTRSAPELGSVLAKAINQSLAAKVVRMNRAEEDGRKP
ncbi:MAG: Crp/Fnr family transcriptional regulator [Sphingomonadaceae bacterium]